MNEEERTTLPLWTSEEAKKLLINAEEIVYEECCQNGCNHHREGIYPGECPHFKAPLTAALINCEAYWEGDDA